MKTHCKKSPWTRKNEPVQKLRATGRNKTMEHGRCVGKYVPKHNFRKYPKKSVS